jgi:predicted phage terminase large subunit-like protein
MLRGMLRRGVGDESLDDLHLYCKRGHLACPERIVAIEPVGAQVFYDLFVPFYNNYLAEGLIHHNSAKSWSIARVLLILGSQSKLRILCVRELQLSLAESVHKLLSDQIEALGLGAFYTVQRDGIYGANGTEFIFTGIKNNADKLKSMEGVDICWVEEAQTISTESLEILIPTIRKPGSRLWFSYNPRYDDDPVHVMFSADPLPPGTMVIEMNYTENPWFPDVLRPGMEQMRVMHPLMFEHIWLGKCVPSLSTALWQWDDINKNRVLLKDCPDFARIVVAVDPAVTANKKSDETGITVVACTKTTPRHYYVLADLSGRYLPEAWARKVLQAYDSHEAGAIVAETNQGGLMVTETIRNVCRTDGRATPSLKGVHASKGKAVRAEPIAALYSQGLVHHAGALPELEKQLLHFDPNNANQPSPDRMDSLVWGLTELSSGRAPMKLAEGVLAKFTLRR